MLTYTYEQSLNKGVTKLNTETNLLADNPLINEISIIVAKQLLSKSKEDPEALYKLLTQEQRESLMTLQMKLEGGGHEPGCTYFGTKHVMNLSERSQQDSANEN